jgi:hypothetical protein
MRNWATKRNFSRRSIDSDVQFQMLGTAASPETFFNLAEAAEKREDDAIVARTVIVALPCGLPRDVQFRMLVEIAQIISSALGTPVLVVRHEKNGETEEERNPHGHLLFATRDWDETTFSFAKKKHRKLDDWRTGGLLIEEFRAAWEKILNANLAPGKLPADRRSHRRRGEKRLACIHLGRAATEREKRTGRPSPLRELNALIETHARLLHEVTTCETEIEELEQAIARANANAPTQNPTTSSIPSHKDKEQNSSGDGGTTQPLVPPAAGPVAGSSIPDTAKFIVDSHTGIGAKKIDLSDAADVLVPSKSCRSRSPNVSDGIQQPKSFSEGTPEPLQQPISQPISPRDTEAQFAGNADSNHPKSSFGEVREKPTAPGTDISDAGDVLLPPEIPSRRMAQKRRSQKSPAAPGETTPDIRPSGWPDCSIGRRKSIPP